MLSSRGNAIGGAHFKIAGGMLALSLALGGYVVIVLAVTGLYMYSELPRVARITSYSVDVLLIMQCVGLYLLGSVRISGCIRNDMTSQMIESHRLMPIPSWRAVLSYMIGGGAHAICFGLLSSALIFIYAAIAGVESERIVSGQALVFLFAALIWTATVLGTFLVRYFSIVVILLTLFGFWLVWALYIFLPGFALLVGPLIGDSVFSVSSPTQKMVLMVYPISFLVQGAFIALFFIAACRMYRGTFRTAFSVLQSILLLLAWAFTSAAGLALWSSFHLFSSEESNRNQFAEVQIMTSIAFTLVICNVPLHTLVTTLRHRPMPLAARVGMLVLITAVASLLLVGVAPFAGYSMWVVVGTVLLIGSQVTIAYCAMRLLERFRPLFKWLMYLGGFALLWFGPLLLDLARAVITQTGGFTLAGSFSPLGLLFALWKLPDSDLMEPAINPIPGLIALWFLGAIMITLTAVVRRSPKSIIANIPKQGMAL